MFYLSGLNIGHVPRFERVEDNGDPHESPDLLAHNALWSAMRISIVENVGASVELRLTAHPLTRQIGIALLVMAPTQNVSGLSVLRVLERLLPSDYGWSHAEITSGGQVETPKVGQGEHWHVARLTRKIMLFDLPMVLASEIASAHHAPQTANMAAAQVALMAAQTYQAQTTSPPRRIPMLGVPWDVQRLQGGLSIPMLTELREIQPQRLRLFEELQQCAPAVVSIALHPVCPEIGGDRGIATHLYSGLSAFGGPSPEHNTGSNVADVTYARYSAPMEQLCKMSIRVAGLDEYTALAIAHSLCAQYGGLKAFSIQSPQQPLPNLNHLAVPDVHEGDFVKRWLASERGSRSALPTFPRAPSSSLYP